MRQFIPATRSLIVLIDLRAIGVSAKRRSASGVFFGSSSDLVPDPYLCRTDGSGAVLRWSAGASLPPSARNPARRTGSQIFSAIFIHPPAPGLPRAIKMDAPRRPFKILDSYSALLLVGF